MLNNFRPPSSQFFRSPYNTNFGKSWDSTLTTRPWLQGNHSENLGNKPTFEVDGATGIGVVGVGVGIGVGAGLTKAETEGRGFETRSPNSSSTRCSSTTSKL